MKYARKWMVVPYQKNSIDNDNINKTKAPTDISAKMINNELTKEMNKKNTEYGPPAQVTFNLEPPPPTTTTEEHSSPIFQFQPLSNESELEQSSILNKSDTLPPAKQTRTAKKQRQNTRKEVNESIQKLSTLLEKNPSISIDQIIKEIKKKKSETVITKAKDKKTKEILPTTPTSIQNFQTPQIKWPSRTPRSKKSLMSAMRETPLNRIREEEEDNNNNQTFDDESFDISFVNNWSNFNQ